MNEELAKYYEYLKNAGADVPESFDSFAATLQDEKSARNYYSYLVDNEFDVPDSYESFAKTLALKKKEFPGVGFGLLQSPSEAGFGMPSTGQPTDSQPSQIASGEPPIESPPDKGAILADVPAKINDQSAFWNRPIEDVEADLRAEMQAEGQKQQSTPGFILPGQQKQMAFDRPGVQQVPGAQQIADNKFEAKKDELKNLIVKQDKAVTAEKIQKYTDAVIGKIDKELAKQPREVLPNQSVRNEKAEMLRMAKEILEQVRDTDDQGGFFDGLTSMSPGGYLPFISAIADAPTLRKLREISQKSDLDEGEQTLMTAEAIRQEFEANKEHPNSYVAGRVLAAMVPYMGEFMLTGGGYTGMKQLASNALKTGLGAAAAKPAVNNLVIKPLSTMAGVAAQTSMNPVRVINTTNERMTPQLKLAVNLDKNELQGLVDPLGKPGESFGKAFAKAFGTQAMEILTERFGQWSNELGKAMKVNGDWFPQVVFGKWMEKRGLIDLNKAKEVAKAIGWDGIIQEIWFEEYPNKILQNLVTGDQEWSPDFFNPVSEEFLQMIPATLVMSGAPLAGGAIGRLLRPKQPTLDLEGLEAEPQGSPEAFESIRKMTEQMKEKEAPAEETTAATPQEELGQEPEDIRATEDEQKVKEAQTVEPGQEEGRPTIEGAVSKFEAGETPEGENYGIDDLVSDLSAVADEHPKGAEIRDAIRKYEEEAAYDREELGMRGDPEQYEGALINAVKGIISEETKPAKDLTPEEKLELSQRTEQEMREEQSGQEAQNEVDRQEGNRKFFESELPTKKPTKKERIREDDLPKGEVNIQPKPTPKIKLTPPRESLEGIVSKDPLRMGLTGVFQDSKRKVRIASDGFVMVEIPDQTITEDAYTTPKGEFPQGYGEGDKIPFPKDYQKLFPDPKDRTAKTVQIDNIMDDLTGTVRANDFTDAKVGFATRIKVGEKEHFFDPDILSRALTAFKKNGVDEVTAYFGEEKKALLIEGGGIRAIVMPMYIDPDSRSFKTLNLGGEAKQSTIQKRSAEEKPVGDTSIDESFIKGDIDRETLGMILAKNKEYFQLIQRGIVGITNVAFEKDGDVLKMRVFNKSGQEGGALYVQPDFSLKSAPPILPEKSKRSGAKELPEPQEAPVPQEEPAAEPPRQIRGKAEIEAILEKPLQNILKESPVSITRPDGSKAKMKAKDAYVEMKRLYKLLNSQKFQDCIGNAK